MPPCNFPQREANYNRRLLLTPTGNRPGYNCPAYVASVTSTSCAIGQPCTSAGPNYCVAPLQLGTKAGLAPLTPVQGLYTIPSALIQNCTKIGV